MTPIMKDQMSGMVMNVFANLLRKPAMRARSLSSELMKSRRAATRKSAGTWPNIDR